MLRMQRGITENYLSLSTKVGQESLSHLPSEPLHFCVHLLIPSGSAGHRFMTLWYSESSRGLGMWPVETLWWANSRPTQWARGSSTMMERLLSTFQIVAWYSLGLEGTTLWLSSLTSVRHPAESWDCLKMPSDGGLLPSKDVVSTGVPLWKSSFLC